MVWRKRVVEVLGSGVKVEMGNGERLGGTAFLYLSGLIVLLCEFLIG